MGFRDYNPGLNRFTSRDMYNGALADMDLGMDPFTGNRYAFTGGNPISRVELDGHEWWNPVSWFSGGGGSTTKTSPKTGGGLLTAVDGLSDSGLLGRSGGRSRGLPLAASSDPGRSGVESERFPLTASDRLCNPS
jgi:RHS repeat-associated protein